MENLQLLKMLHGLAGMLLFAALLALSALCWRSRARREPLLEEGGESEMDAQLAPEPAVQALALAAREPLPAEDAAEGAEPDVPSGRSVWPVLWAITLLLALVGLPLSGWWLAHLTALPLGQPWLLGSSLLFLPGSLCALWLASRVTGRRPGVRLGLVLAFLGLLCFGVSLALMVVKPVELPKELQWPAWLAR